MSRAKSKSASSCSSSPAKCSATPVCSSHVDHHHHHHHHHQQQQEQTRHSIMCPDYPSALFATINQFRLSDIFTDVIIYVDGVPFACHRLILAAASPYFRAMFSYNFRESTEGNVRIQDITPWTMKRLLEFIYTGHTDITLDNLFEMFNASVMLSIKELTDLLIKFLFLQIDIYNCIQIEQLATVYSLEKLRRTTLSFIVEHFMILYEKQLFVHLNEHTLMEILSDDNLDIPKEEYVFLTIVQWVNYRPIEREQYFQSLFKFIRLNSISDSDFVTNSMRNEKLVEKHPTCLRTLKDFYSNNFMPDLLGPIRPSTQIRYHLLVIEMPCEDEHEYDDEKDEQKDDRSRRRRSTIPKEPDESIASFYQKFSAQLQFNDDHHLSNNHCSTSNNLDANHCDHSSNQFRSPSPDCQQYSSSHCLLRAYDFFRQRWRFLGRLPELFADVSCVSTETTLYLFGGQLCSGDLSDRIWIFPFSTLKWHMLSIRLPCPRAQHTCVLFHNVVLLFFGTTTIPASPCHTVDMFDLTSETWTCLGENVPSYQCEPIVATGQRLLLSNRNDTHMLHTYKLRMPQPEDTIGQAIKRTTSTTDEPSSSITNTKEKKALSRTASLDSPSFSEPCLTSAGYYMLPRNNNIGRFSLVTHDDDLYLVYWQSKQVYRFNLVRNEILSKQSLPYAFVNDSQCVLVDRRLVVSGLVRLSNLTDVEKQSLSIVIQQKKNNNSDYHRIIQIYEIDDDRWYILKDQQLKQKHLLLVAKLS